MAGFAQRLKEIVETSGMTVADISRHSGISVSLLYKYQSGTRFPDSQGTLDRLMDALLLDMTARHDLLRDYQIERIGVNIYSCFDELKKTIQKLAESEKHSNLGIQETMEQSELPSVITGTNNVNSAVKYLLCRELAKPEGKVGMMVPLRYEYACEYMAHALENCNPHFGQVDHLFTLRATGTPTALRYNMAVLRRVLPWMMNLSHYEPRYSYLVDPDDGTAIYPYYIITGDGVLLIGGRFQEAVFLNDPDVCKKYQIAFDEVKRRFRPCFSFGPRNAGSYFSAFHQVQKQLKQPVRADILASAPCMLPMLPRERAMKYLPEDLSKLPGISEIIDEYYTGSSTLGYKTFFTLRGLRYVLETGDLMEVRGVDVPRISREDTMLAVERLIEAAERGLVELRVFRENVFPAESNVCLTRYEHAIVLFCESSNRDAVTANIAETSFSHIASEYIDKAELIGDVFSPEESLTMTRRELRRFRNEI